MPSGTSRPSYACWCRCERGKEADVSDHKVHFFRCIGCGLAHDDYDCGVESSDLRSQLADATRERDDIANLLCDYRKKLATAVEALESLESAGMWGVAEGGCLWCWDEEGSGERPKQDHNYVVPVHYDDCPIRKALAAIRGKETATECTCEPGAKPVFSDYDPNCPKHGGGQAASGSGRSDGGNG